MTSVADLFALQELDLAIEGHRAEIADIESREDEPEDLVEARATFRLAQETLREAEHAFKEREFEADELKAKIEPFEQKLYQGGVTSPKELEDLQAEVDSLKRRRSALEDQALESMEALEAAQAALTEAESTLNRLLAEHGAEAEDLGARKTELEGEVVDLEARRVGAAEAIDAATLNLYDRLRASRAGRAVAKVQGGSCQGCRISLPMNVIQRARGGATLVQCTNCERILYVT